MLKRLILIFILISSVHHINATHYQFKHYDSNDGLSQNSVLSICQDHIGFMWFGTRNGLCRFDGKSFRTYRRSELPGALGNDHISTIFQGPNNELWIGTDCGLYIYSPISDSFRLLNEKANDGTTITGTVNIIVSNKKKIYIANLGQGVFVYDIASKKLVHHALKDTPAIMSMAIGDNDTVWVGCFQSGLHYTQDNFAHILAYKDAQNNYILKKHSITGIVIKGQDLFFSSSTNGLHKLHFPSRTVSSCITSHDGKGLFAHSLLSINDNLLMMTETGLFVYNISNGSQSFYKEEATNPYSLSDDHLQTAFLDKDGGIWIGTYFGGVNYSPNMSYTFVNYFPRVDIATSLYGKRVRPIDEDSAGRIWVGTEDGGLGYLSPQTGRFHKVQLSTHSRNIQSLKVIGDELWVGAFQSGIEVIDIHTGHVLRHLRQTPNQQLSDDNVFAIQPLHDGRVAIGSYGGLDIYSPTTQSFVRISEIPSHTIYAIKEDHQRNLWTAVYGKGIYMLKPGTRHWKCLTSHSSNLDNVVSLCEDSRGGLWAITEGNGVFRYNTRTHKFVSVAIPSYNSKKVVTGMVEDHQGKLWITTNEGLLRYDPYTQATQIFTTANGLLDNTFNQGSAFCSRSGRIYIGSQSGLTAFSPNSFTHRATIYPIVATDLLVNGLQVNSLQDSQLLKQDITLARKLTLNYDQNSFAIKMAVLSYRDAQTQQLEYILEGFDKQWQYLFSDGYIRYTNLPAGHYTLIVRNISTGNSQTYTLDITVRTPWWNTWWAWLLYITAIAAMIYFAYRYLTQRSEMLHRMALNRFKYEKEKELYRSKINFFTNVAHEIRTPLTLIKCPLTDIIEEPNMNDTMRESLTIVDKNVTRLLDLTNQLLDFRKTEQAGLRLNIERCNIGDVVKNVYVRFSSVMKKKNIEHNLCLPHEPLYAYIDRESFIKIISNLINNAVKYGDKHISVTVGANIQEDCFSVRVENDGAVIPQALRQKVFTPFFRAETATTASTTGTGIGLALARTLTELHGGTLTIVDSNVYNIFVVSIPVGKQATLLLTADETPLQATFNKEEEEAVPTEELDIEEADIDKVGTVLIVEDNKAMQQYEKQQMRHLYHVLTADNGQKALEVLKEHTVDIIVSDAMMEPIDGFELCRQIKEDVNFSHIPFVLLTALTLDSAKIKGMESGADSYIEKPFSTDYLLNVIQNLLRTRENIKKAYATSPFTPQETVSISKADEAFIQRLKDVVSVHLKDSEFGITQLASYMCMSRTNLNRKIRGTFNLTPNNYIKIERLKLAAQLMKDGDCKVNEVCYTVGFSSPSYFTQCFQKQFGLLPKDFIGGN